MSDTEITCQDCQTPFLFTEKEQDFYSEKGFSPPKRCRHCRQARKNNQASGERPAAGSADRGDRGGRRDGGHGAPRRELHDAVCADCGADTQVPFKPSGDRPVRCRDCYTRTKPRR